MNSIEYIQKHLFNPDSILEEKHQRKNIYYMLLLVLRNYIYIEYCDVYMDYEVLTYFHITMNHHFYSLLDDPTVQPQRKHYQGSYNQIFEENGIFNQLIYNAQMLSNIQTPINRLYNSIYCILLNHDDSILDLNQEYDYQINENSSIITEINNNNNNSTFPPLPSPPSPSSNTNRFIGPPLPPPSPPKRKPIFSNRNNRKKKMRTENGNNISGGSSNNDEKNEFSSA